MKIGYLDLFSGISGDMMLGAMIDSGLDIKALSKNLSKLNLRGYTLETRKVKKGSILCTKVSVKVNQKTKHSSASEIIQLIKKSKLPNSVKLKATKIFECLAKVEGKLHGILPSKVEFHEIGAVDSIVDIVGCCLGLEMLGIERLYCSCVPISRGEIKGSHGLLPVPAPATLELLKGFPVVYVDVDRELVTPTGAAILKVLCEGAGYFPHITIEKIGYGAGDLEIEGRPNFMRLIIGETATAERDLVWVVEANIDDTTGKVIAHVTDQLFEAGALDAWSTPIYMKKSRPAVKLSCIVDGDKLSSIERLILNQTSTFGVRRYMVERTKLHRDWLTVSTKFGPIKMKRGFLDDELIKVSPEYEDVRSIAIKHNKTMEEVELAAIEGYRAGRDDAVKRR